MPKAKPGLTDAIESAAQALSRMPICKGMLLSYTTQRPEDHNCFLCGTFVPADTLHKCDGKQAEVRDAEDN